MIQFLRFDKSREFDVEFEIIKGREALKFFFKTFGKVRMVGKTRFVHYLRYRKFAGFNKLRGSF